MSKFNIGDIVRVNDKSFCPEMIGRVAKVIGPTNVREVIKVRFEERLPETLRAYSDDGFELNYFEFKFDLVSRESDDNQSNIEDNGGLDLL
jgi:hypothetical protein